MPQTGDILFFGADKRQIVTDAMGALRLKLGRDLALTNSTAGHRCGWLTSRCSKKIEEGGLAAMHHPFTSPRDMSPEGWRQRGQRHRQRL